MRVIRNTVKCPIPLSGSMIHLFALMITGCLSDHVGGNNTTGLGNRTVFRDSGGSNQYNFVPDQFCYECRSDYTPECINAPEDPERNFGKKCDLKTVQAFLKNLEDDPPTQPLPQYDNSLRSLGRQSEAKTKYGCYTSISANRLFVIRHCYPNDPERHGDSCSHCSTTDKRNPAKCCVCSESFCNNKKAGGSHPSPPAFQNLLFANLLSLLMIGMLFTKAHF